MSLAWQGKGVSGRTLGGLGVVECQSLGCAGSSLRVSGPISFQPSSLPCSAPSAELQPHVHPQAGSCRCGRSASGDGSSRACASFPWLLQLSLCHSQGHGWVAPGDRPLAPQQLSGRLPFPHGDNPVCSPVSASWRLDGIPGPPGCLPPGTSPSVVSTLPEVLRGSVGLPVPRSLFWPVDGSAGVYALHGPGVFDHASSRIPDSPVS